MPNRQPRKSRQQWQSLISKFNNQSALSQQQFCDAEHLSLGAFKKWLYKFAAQDRLAVAPKQQTAVQTPEPVSPAFGPVMIRPSNHLPSGCCLELPGNVRLHTQSIPSVEFLQNLVKVMGYGC